MATHVSRGSFGVYMTVSGCTWQTVELFKIQLTLPKSKSHKSNNRLSRSLFQVLFSLFLLFYAPHKSNFL